MSVDETKLQLYSGSTTDKIAVFSSKTDSSGIGTNATATIGPVVDPTDTPEVRMFSIDNPYGKKCLMTLSWSPDGVSYYPQNQPVYYYNATFSGYYWKALGFGGCSDSKIYFGISTQYNDTQNVYFQFALDSPT